MRFPSVLGRLLALEKSCACSERKRNLAPPQPNRLTGGVLLAVGGVPRAAAHTGGRRNYSKCWRGSRNSQDARTNGAVRVGIANGVSATFIAPCTITVNTVPTTAYTTTRGLGR